MMSVTVLATKLHIPERRARLVARPHLTNRLQAALRRGARLTLIAAPAGFGKTTLLADWLAEHPRPVAWLALDEADNEAGRFFVYLITALHRIDERIGAEALALLETYQRTSPNPPPIESILTLLINDLTATPRPLTLVLDDYHLIENTLIHDGLAFLLEHLPASAHLVIASRQAPPLPLGRLRARHQLVELRATDLRFSRQEAADFLQDVMGIDLPPDAVAALEARTEGWVAGLQLAALALQTIDPPEQQRLAAFIDAFSGDDRYVVAYLGEEVLRHQPDDVQRFLLQTAILDRLTAPLCEAVTRCHDAQAMLTRLDRANLFIIPLDHQQQWYRYHHLFRDLLRSEAARRYADQLADLHHRASIWYGEEGLYREAVAHAFQSGDMELAAEQIARGYGLLLSRADLFTMLRWIDALPAETYKQRSWLHLGRGWALVLTGQLDEAESLLDQGALDLTRLERPADMSPDEFATFKAQRAVTIDTLRAHIARYRGDLTQALDTGQRVLAAAEHSNFAQEAAIRLGMAVTHEALGQPEQAEAHTQEALALADKHDHPYLIVSALHTLGRLAIHSGDLARAVQHYRRGLALADRPESEYFLGAMHSGLGNVLREQNQLETAADHILQGVRMTRLGGDFIFLRDAYTTLARLRLAQGDPAAALAALEECMSLLHHAIDLHYLRDLHTWRARAWLAQGADAPVAREQALAWAETLPPGPDDAALYRDELAYTTRAHILREADQIAAAITLYDRLIERAEAVGRAGRALESRLGRALAYATAGDRAAALADLRQALALAGPGGWVRTIIDMGPGIIPLLQAAYSGTPAHRDFIRTLLAAAGVDVASAPLVDPLTDRELDVLNLIASGLSNREIAAELSLATGTVRWHTKNIYQKLDVHNRTHAAARARELGLLG